MSQEHYRLVGYNQKPALERLPGQILSDFTDLETGQKFLFIIDGKKGSKHYGYNSFTLNIFRRGEIYTFGHRLKYWLNQNTNEILADDEESARILLEFFEAVLYDPEIREHLAFSFDEKEQILKIYKKPIELDEKSDEE